MSSLQLWQDAIKQYKSENPSFKGKLPKKGSMEYDQVKAIHVKLVAEARGTEYVPPPPTYKSPQAPEVQTPVPTPDWTDEIIQVVNKHKKVVEPQQTQTQAPPSEPQVQAPPAKRRGRPPKARPEAVQVSA